MGVILMRAIKAATSATVFSPNEIEKYSATKAATMPINLNIRKVLGVPKPKQKQTVVF